VRGGNAGVFGVNNGTGNGVVGRAVSQLSSGVHGENRSREGFGVTARSDAPPASATGIVGSAFYAENFGVPQGAAGIFNGQVAVNGRLINSLSGFAIDHPGDPANKFIYHCSVESNDMMNVYNGNIETDGDGNATVELPGYFEVLNRDFRYQLTAVGQFAQVIVAEEVSNNWASRRRPDIPKRDAIPPGTAQTRQSGRGNGEAPPAQCWTSAHPSQARYAR
jgi:trimeric autotransporter adhesin